MHSFMHTHRKEEEESAHRGRGVMTMPTWFYDLLVGWFVLRGHEQGFRRKIADLARLQPGEAVLDVGCGSGTLALVAKRCVGQEGRVCGLDPSLQMLSGARRKAARAGLTIDFRQAGIEQIPFPDQSFDVVLSTFMLHHVPDDLKRQGLVEVARVLKTGARLLVVDFKRPEEHEPGQPHAGSSGLQDLTALIEEAGLSVTESGEIPFRIRSLGPGHQNHGFVLASKGSV